MRTRLGKALAVLVPVLLAGFLAWRLAIVGGGGISAPAPAATSPAPTPIPSTPIHVCSHPGCYAGVALAATSKVPLTAFAHATGARPGIVETYQAFGKPFPLNWVRSLSAQRILPLIQINPRSAPLAAINAGRYDAYLRSYARQVSEAGVPVGLSFAHEMNGRWYPWGYQHNNPAVFIAAWRHVHQVLASSGARKVIWVWTVDHNVAPASRAVSPIQPWWPGASYVDWVGVDIYYITSHSSFRRSFDPTLKAIRQFTTKPILITETAVPPQPGAVRQILNLFAGVKAHGLLGVIWYDQRGRQNWYLNNRPAAVAAYRRGLAQMLRQ